MDRRQFLTAAAAFAVSAAAQTTTTQQATLRTSSATPPLPVMPLDFMGLSYESAQLTNPDYFSAKNTDLVSKFRTLSTSGVLRLGGHLSNESIWDGILPSPAEQKQMDGSKSAYEWLTVDSIGGKDHQGVITQASIRNLRGFLDATGWKLLYGLNPLTGSIERAAAEAAFVQTTIGPHLIAFQIGNEPDRFRDPSTKDYNTFDEYWQKYQAYVKAIRTRTPQARFAGPDTTRRGTDWELAYAEHAKGDAVLITSHYYAVGTVETLDADTKRLLSPDKKLLEVDIPAALQAASIAGVPYRMSEGNSCPHGGEDNLSNAYASALWSADYLLLTAQAGFAGINLHGGGVGRYAPIVGEVATGFTDRPVYYGMLLASKFTGYRFVKTALDAGSANVTAYVGSNSGGSTLLAVLNKDAMPLDLNLQTPLGKPQKAWALTGTQLNSKDGTQFNEIAAPKAQITVPAYSGLLVKFSA